MTSQTKDEDNSTSKRAAACLSLGLCFFFPSNMCWLINGVKKQHRVEAERTLNGMGIVPTMSSRQMFRYRLQQDAAVHG